MKILKDVSDQTFIDFFKSCDSDDKEVVKVFFREWLSNRPHIQVEKNLDPAFCKLASEVLPDILAITVRSKATLKALKGECNEFNIRGKDISKNSPYLIREPNSDNPAGMVRFSNVEKMDSGEFKVSLLDYIPFDVEDKPEILCKFNIEKMQMFSVVYRSHDAWGQLDTDGEYTDSEELRKAVIHVAKNGVNLNIQHDSDKGISKDDAQVIEFYQARTSWNDEGLEVRKGDVVATTQFYDTDNGRKLWNELKEGEYTTYSMEGVANE